MIKRTKTVDFRRKGKTNYKKRIRMMLSDKTRLVVRVMSRTIVAQFVNYDPQGDRVVVGANSLELKNRGWKLCRRNLPAAYLLGLIIGLKAKKAGITEAVIDIGRRPSVKGSRMYAVLKGVVDAGIVIPHSDSILPSEERIKGSHIAGFDKDHFMEIKNKIKA